MLPSNKYPTGSRSASVVAARCLIAGLIPLVLAGCEAPLNLSGVEQEQNKSLRRTDQLQALVANDQVQVAVGNNGLVLTRPLGEHLAAPDSAR